MKDKDKLRETIASAVKDAKRKGGGSTKEKDAAEPSSSSGDETNSPQFRSVLVSHKRHVTLAPSLPVIHLSNRLPTISARPCPSKLLFESLLTDPTLCEYPTRGQFQRWHLRPCFEKVRIIQRPYFPGISSFIGTGRVLYPHLARTHTYLLHRCPCSPTQYV